MIHRRLYLGPLTDNRRWDMVSIRPDDVIVVTPPKCGTTWMQTMVALLISGDLDIETELSVKMPWVDIRVREMAEVSARLEAMEQRRCMKSHTPMDGLPLDDHAQYICVFRHPLDAHFSYRNHVRNLPLPWFDLWYPEDDQDGTTFRRFLDGGPEGFDTDALPLAHILRHFTAAKAVSDRPNVSLWHYADLKADLSNAFSQLAHQLGITHPKGLMEKLIQVASFEHMKSNAKRYAPSGGTGFFKSDEAFFDRGTNGQWKGHLSDKELSAYDAIMDAHLSPADRAWLENGAAPVNA